MMIGVEFADCASAACITPALKANATAAAASMPFKTRRKIIRFISFSSDNGKYYFLWQIQKITR
jgi:hypothetical protein